MQKKPSHPKRKKHGEEAFATKIKDPQESRKKRKTIESLGISSEKKKK